MKIYSKFFVIKIEFLIDYEKRFFFSQFLHHFQIFSMRLKFGLRVGQFINLNIFQIFHIFVENRVTGTYFGGLGSPDLGIRKSKAEISEHGSVVLCVVLSE